MDQNSVDHDFEALQEWYIEYMTQDIHIAIQSSTYTEPLDLEAIEAQTLDLMREIDVIDGFCSICHTMLDDWPDIAAKKEETRIADADGDNGSTVPQYLPSNVLSPGLWFEYEGDVSCVLPCQGQTVRLDTATRKGCRCCGLILQNLKDSKWLSLYRKIESRLQLLGKPSTISLLACREGENTEDDLVLGFPGRLFNEAPSFSSIRMQTFPCQDISREIAEPFYTKSWEVSVPQSLGMRLAQQWTTSCLESHPACDLQRPPRYPTRLLSIAKDPVQLVITAGWVDRPLYATLSHCWGKKEFETLKSTTIEELRYCVSNRFLSKTFLDAVKIARAAGLAYLWIDSLCIIQDGKKDWEVEAGMMASVYGGSSLNIAASSAKDGTEGCFLKPQYHGGGFTAQISTARRKKLLQFCSTMDYRKSVTQSHLSTRAWTVQEKILAPRTLHCGDQGFFWECRTHMASEYFPCGFSEANSFLRNNSVLPEKANASWYWSDLKRWYSSCHLTNAGDKLIALSGVVRSIQMKTGDQYCAGLWRSTLEQELYWVALDPQQRPEYRAPSWSWAAVDGLVHSKDLKRRQNGVTYVHVRSISVIHPGGNALGAVLHGTLSLHCDVIVAGTVAADDAARARREPYMVRRRLQPGKQPRICFSSVGEAGLVFPFSLDCAEQTDSRLGHTMYYLPLYYGNLSPEFSSGDSGDDGADKPDIRVYGIVLEELNATLNRYRRIGSFEYREPGWWDSVLDDSECSSPQDYAAFMRIVTNALSRGSGGQTVNII